VSAAACAVVTVGTTCVDDAQCAADERCDAVGTLCFGPPLGELLHEDFEVNVPFQCNEIEDPAAELDRFGGPGVCHLKDAEPGVPTVLEIAPDLPGAADLTMTTWMRLSSAANAGAPLACFGEQGNVIVGFDNGGGPLMVSVRETPGVPQFQVLQVPELSQATLESEEWFFAAVALDRREDTTVVTVWVGINGEADLIKASTSFSTVLHDDVACPFVAGGLFEAVPEPCDLGGTFALICQASFDDMRAFDRALIDAEVRHLFTEGP
jgi:hypothetical protein